jgi:hypothetical protein
MLRQQILRAIIYKLLAIIHSSTWMEIAQTILISHLEVFNLEIIQLIPHCPLFNNNHNFNQQIRSFPVVQMLTNHNSHQISVWVSISSIRLLLSSLSNKLTLPISKTSLSPLLPAQLSSSKHHNSTLQIHSSTIQQATQIATLYNLVWVKGRMQVSMEVVEQETFSLNPLTTLVAMLTQQWLLILDRLRSQLNKTSKQMMMMDCSMLISPGPSTKQREICECIQINLWFLVFHCI